MCKFKEIAKSIKYILNLIDILERAIWKSSAGRRLPTIGISNT